MLDLLLCASDVNSYKDQEELLLNVIAACTNITYYACQVHTHTYIYCCMVYTSTIYPVYVVTCSHIYTCMHSNVYILTYIYYRAAHTCIHSYRPIYLYIVPVRSSGLRRYIHICAFGRKVDYQETREELTSAFSAPVALSLPRERRGCAGDR